MVQLDQPGAARRLSATAIKYAQHGEFHRALRALHKATVVISACHNEVESSIASLFVLESAAILGRNTDDEIQQEIHKIYQHVAFLLSGRYIEATGTLALHTAAKGANFDSTITDFRNMRLPDSVQSLLENVQASESELSDPLAEFELPNGAESAALFFAGSHELEEGEDPHTRLRNLQRQADHAITHEMLAGIPALPASALTVEDLQRTLPTETVLLSLFVGEGYHSPLQQIIPTVSGIAITRERIESRTSMVSNIDGGRIEFRRGSHMLIASPIAAGVDMLLRAISDDPLHRNLTLSARNHLTMEGRTLCGGFLGSMDRWYSEGKRHLLIWPHGPLHFAPFHLFMRDNWTVADDWTVTQIAACSSLRIGTKDSEARKGRGFLAFASAQGGLEHGFPEEEPLEDHAEEIAALMAGEAVVGSAATPQRLLATATTARYLHIAAHGAHNEWAPWFQCIYLSPDGASDGRLFAYDILQADLRGVELVTLSSCESALGRFDMNDNLQGIPAAFLTAGVSAIVGCLWPVNPVTALDFFSSLYGHLSRHRQRVAAFRAAQIETRVRHPNYRDWGAFVYIGDWT
jgi:hypothetical protein